jgi:hypothetical protein
LYADLRAGRHCFVAVDVLAAMYRRHPGGMVFSVFPIGMQLCTANGLIAKPSPVLTTMELFSLTEHLYA